jgi:hypothetical protein
VSLTPYLIHLCRYRHAKYRVDLTHTEVIIYYLCGCDEVYELLQTHEPLLPADGLSPRILLIYVLQGPQMFLDNYVTALVVQLLSAELGEIELFKEGDHVVLETVGNCMFLSGVSIG